MNEPIRMLHFADIHVGMENYGRIDSKTGVNTRVLDFLRRLTEIVDYAIEQDVDLVIFAGDAFKTRTPNPTYVREFARRIKKLANHCPVVLLLGNHDIPAVAQKAASIEIFQTLEVPNVIVGRSDGLHLIETKRGPVQVATVPYPVRQRLASDAAVEGVSLGQLDDLLRENVGLMVADLAAQVDKSIPAVLTGHFSVMGARLGSERSVMLGRDVAVMKSALDDDAWDYVALGHIHCFQDMNEGNAPPIVYSGSIERIDFGEEKDPKGFCMVNLQRGGTSYEFVELAVRPFVTIRVDVREEADPTAGILRKIGKSEFKDAVVRVIVKANHEQETLIRDRDIMAALDEASYVAAIQREIDYPQRRRLGTEKPESMTPVELLNSFFNSRGAEGTRINQLVEHAERLFNRPEDFDS